MLLASRSVPFELVADFTRKQADNGPVADLDTALAADNVPRCFFPSLERTHAFRAGGNKAAQVGRHPVRRVSFNPPGYLARKASDHLSLTLRVVAL